MKNIRDDLINTMFKTLYTQGYHASNLNAILKEAGTSKGGMYHLFSSKQELAIVSIEKVIGDFIHTFWEEPIQNSENTLQTLLDLIMNLSNADIIDGMRIDYRYGCPMNNMIQELSAVDDAFSTTLRELFNRWEQSINLALTTNKKLLRIDIDVNHASAFIIAAIEGSYTYAKIHQSKDSFEHAMNQVILYIKSLLR
jgi:TetR/AcrR family transcriptional regulator, transcriptional repressor for nem operon